MASPSKVVFVCLHGSAKSLIAAEWAKRLAQSRGLQAQFASGGTEPDAEVPPHVVLGLTADGISTPGLKPHPATAAHLAGATLLVTFGPDLSKVAPTGVPIERWDDVPAVADGYETARQAIRQRVEALLARL